MRKQSSKIVIPCCDSYDFIELNKVVRFEGLQNYTKVYIKDSNTIVSSTNIGYYKASLQERGFFCCHKSHLVNEQHILRYQKSGQIEMSDGSSVPVSRRKRPVFLSAIVEKFSIRSESQPIMTTISLQGLQHTSHQ